MADQPENIFNDGQETPVNKEAENKNIQESELTDLLGQIKNEKGEQKYKSIQDALVGLKHAQEYIPHLKDERKQEQEELEALRKEAQRIADLEQAVLELTRSKETPDTAGKSLNEEDIANLIQKTLSRTQQEAIQKQNIEAVVSSVKKTFGDKAESVFYEKAKEMGLTVEEMNGLAAKTPKAVLTMLGIRGEDAHKQSNFTPTRGTVNTDTFVPRTDTFLGKSEKAIMLGATTQDIQEESKNALRLVEELHSQGMSVHDLTDPKVFFKTFK